jgi:hypothetical protein
MQKPLFTLGQHLQTEAGKASIYAGSPQGAQLVQFLDTVEEANYLKIEQMVDELTCSIEGSCQNIVDDLADDEVKDKIETFTAMLEDWEKQALHKILKIDSLRKERINNEIVAIQEVLAQIKINFGIPP